MPADPCKRSVRTKPKVREATNLTGMRVRSVVGPAVDFVRVSGSGLSPLADAFRVAAPFGGSAGQDAQVGSKAG